MTKLVTIALPIYKRLEYLPHVLGILSAQDYPHIELLVSDNGMNGDRVREIVESHYSRPYKFRQNHASVTAPTHFNQLLREASGEYFVIMGDDDEISSNFVSELVQQLERFPQASIAFGGQETFREPGVVIGRSTEMLPDILSGEDFILATWRHYKYGFQSVSTFAARTERMIQAGGYPDFFQANHTDDALVVKLCLGSHVVFSPRCTFRNRVQDSSMGWSVSAKGYAAACKQFMRFLEEDATLRDFAKAHPSEWLPLKQTLIEMSWGGYFERWRNIYNRRLTRFQWIRAAFEMPWFPAYYRRVASVLREMATLRLRRAMLRSRIQNSDKGSSDCRLREQRP